MWGDYPRELDSVEKIPNPCGTILCPKSPGHVFKFKNNFFDILSLKNLRSRPYAKVVCQIPKGSDCFGSHIPRVSPPPPLGENIYRCRSHNISLLKAHTNVKFYSQCLELQSITISSTTPLEARSGILTFNTTPLETRHQSNTDHTTPFDACHIRNIGGPSPQ